MSEPARRFARFTSASRPATGATELPDDGMCLSVFLVVRPAGRDREVLLGRIAPDAAWDRLGALDPARVAHLADRWMLPSSHLLLFEGPADAAARIATEQLGRPGLALTGPEVFSEAYRRDGPARDPHWDLHVVFQGRWPADAPLRSPAFAELAFHDVARLPRSAIARGQGDVLALVGLPPAA